ncbi:MAG: translation elongation factor Ts [bacterium]
MIISSDIIAQLREKTGAGIMNCKKALQKSQGNFEKAAAILREEGAALASKKASRSSQEGLIFSYIHTGGKLGVILELNCETDFVARTDEFKNLAQEIAMQVAAANPQGISRKDIPAETIEREREIYVNQCVNEKKPENIIPRIVDGKIEKYFEHICLLDQAYIRDSSGKTKVKDLITNAIGKLGENISVRRFTRFQLGGE